MSFNTKSNNSTKTAASPNDRRNYTKLYGAINNFWTTTITLSDNIFNYSKLAVIGSYSYGDTENYKYYNLSFDIIPGVADYQSSCLLLNGNEMRHMILHIKGSSSSNSVNINGQVRVSNSVNSSAYISAIYGIR